GTSVRYESAANGAGEYTLTNLPPGTYRIEVEKSGFKKLVRPDVILHVQDALAIDLEMAVGSVSDSVTVQAGGALVHTSDGSLSQVIDDKRLLGLPINGRNVIQLVSLCAGVINAGRASATQRQANYGP